MITTYLRDFPPTPSVTDAELEVLLNNSISVSTLEKGIEGYLYVSFTINCKGEDFNFKLHRTVKGRFEEDTTSTLVKTLLNTIQSIVSWTPPLKEDVKNGIPFQRPVDFKMSYLIRIDEDRLHILDEKEKRKYHKKIRL